MIAILRRARWTIALLAPLFLLAGSASAVIDATTYPFSSATGVALEDMSTGTTQLVAANVDDTASVVTNIGFDFWYHGVRHTQFSVNANGLLRLGSTVISTAFDNSTGFVTATNAPKIAPYFDDIFTGTNGKVHFKVTGTAPNRKLIVEWLNMQIPLVGAGSPGAGTFQLWLFESTGLIQTVYGSGMAVNAANGGYSIGLNIGTPVANNTASVTTTGATVSYAAANNTQTNAITAGDSYSFTPPVPTAPSGLNFTAVTAVGMTLNWTDNSSDEFLFIIERSLDGTNFSSFATAAANATSLVAPGLTPGTNYFWRVYAVSSGALSTVLAGSQATLPPGSISSSGGGGLWSAPATWAGGIVPGAGDNVTIVDGSTVTIDTAALAFSVTVGQGGASVLEFEQTTARTLTVGGSVTITGGAVFQSNVAGTQTGHVLSVGGNLTNNGALDFSTNANTAGAVITFTGATNATFSGSGAVTDIRQITMNKGSSSASTLELMPTNFTAQGVNDNSIAGWLTYVNGTMKISGTFTMDNRTFTTPTYIIPATGGIWLNNPNYTVSATASAAATSNNGLFRVTQGTYNIGIGAADQMRGGTGAFFTIEGGTVNVSGAFDPQNAVTYNQSGGTVNVGLVGNTVSAFGTFELFSTASSFIMSGGTINVVNPSTGTTKVDVQIRSPLANQSITGGQVVLGAGAAPASSTYNVVALLPSFTINPTMTMLVNGAAVFMRGTTVVNDGAITSTGASARFDFGSQIGPMSYSGSGVFGTLAAPFAATGVGVSANSLFLTTLNAPIICNRVNLFQGGFVNSNQFTIGNGGASTTVVQIGSTGLTTPGGSFDVSPVHNQGTGGQIILYAFETAPRTTGFEINPTRILTSINAVDNPSGVTLAGGDVTLSSAAAALVLNNGRFITGANTVILSSPTATVTRTNGWVHGNLRKNFGAAANKTFEVGTANGYSPVAVNATAGSFPTDVTATAVQAFAPGITPTSIAIERFWDFTATGITADLTFTYLDPIDFDHAPITEANLLAYFGDAGFYTSVPGTVVVVGANTAQVLGVTTFDKWTLAEPGILLGTDVSITKTDGSATEVPGTPVIYTIVATNAGPVAASTVTIVDNFAASLSNCSTTCIASAGSTCAAGPVAGNINDVASLLVGGTATYTATCDISVSAIGALINTATATVGGAETDPATGNNTATDNDTLVPTADVTITKTNGVTQSTPGLPVTYTIVVTNAGPSAAPTVNVIDLFPATLTSCATTCVGAGGGTCTAGPVVGNINENANLPVGGSATYTASCTLSLSATGTLVNTATATVGGGATDPNTADNSATDTDTIGNTIFNDGFESGDTLLWSATVPLTVEGYAVVGVASSEAAFGYDFSAVKSGEELMATAIAVVTDATGQPLFILGARRTEAFGELELTLQFPGAGESRWVPVSEVGQQVRIEWSLADVGSLGHAAVELDGLVVLRLEGYAGTVTPAGAQLLRGSAPVEP